MEKRWLLKVPCLAMVTATEGSDELVITCPCEFPTEAESMAHSQGMLHAWFEEHGHEFGDCECGGTPILSLVRGRDDH